MIELRLGRTPSWERDGEPVLVAPEPVVVELHGAGRFAAAYDEVADGVGRCNLEGVVVEDRWSAREDGSWRLDRTVVCERPVGVRVGLQLRTAAGRRYGDLRYFAPPALYDRNDLDGDELEDFLDTQTLVYRDDRLSALSVLAYDPDLGLSLALSRLDLPVFDSLPDRPERERSFLQRTDIGSLGFEPVDGEMALVAHYPFVERDRCHALLLRERPGWGAFWPAEAGERLELSYAVDVREAPDFHSALWGSFSDRLRELAPTPTPLAASHEALVEHRTEALMQYYVGGDDATSPAGFVTNCHPQDGKQLSSIVQYGFTGQTVLNAYNTARLGHQLDREDLVTAGHRVADFFVEGAHMPETGLFHNFCNVDTGRMGSWWTGLLLPLAYAEPGKGLEELMGPLYQHMAPAIEQLEGLDGSYLRCMSEDVHALTLLLAYEREHGREHETWLAAANRFGEFLLAGQEADGGWCRAYDHAGEPLRGGWFGANDDQQKSSTATAIPALLELFKLTGDERYRDAAVRAGELVRERSIERIRHNGGVHDSVYAQPQLIDSESILFPLRAMVDLGRIVGGDHWWDGAVKAARLLATWIWLWDVPLPPDSTLARHGFRTTGWAGCDTAGAGYVHPFELLAVPDIVEAARYAGDEALLDVAELIMGGCNQTVAVPGNDWGYAMPGLQEEGYLISYWLIDDPIFLDTSFGGRGKGEGNKTCFPWIPAVAISAYWRLVDAYGTADIAAIREELGALR